MTNGKPGFGQMKFFSINKTPVILKHAKQLPGNFMISTRRSTIIPYWLSNFLSIVQQEFYCTFIRYTAVLKAGYFLSLAFRNVIFNSSCFLICSQPEGV